MRPAHCAGPQILATDQESSMFLPFLTANKRLPRRVTVLALALCAIFEMPAIVAAADPPTQTVEINIAKFAFAPKEVTVAPGTKITWINHDETPHTVTSGDKSFASKGMDTDDKYEHTFAKEGDFNYVCTVHPFMTGVVHVRKQ
jgi:plastocyanin